MWMTINFILCAIHFLVQHVSGLNLIDLPIEDHAFKATLLNKQNNMTVLKSNQIENAKYYLQQQQRFGNDYSNAESDKKEINVDLPNDGSNARRQINLADVDSNEKYYKIQQQRFASYYSNAESDTEERNISQPDHDSNSFNKKRQITFADVDSNSKLNKKLRNRYSDYDSNAKSNGNERFTSPADNHSNGFSKQRQNNLAFVDSKAIFHETERSYTSLQNKNIDAKKPKYIKNYQETGSILHKKEYENYDIKDAQLNTRKPLESSGGNKKLANKKKKLKPKKSISDDETEENFSKERIVNKKNKIKSQLTTLKKLPHKDYDDAEYQHLETKRMYPPVRVRASPMSDPGSPKHIRRYWLISHSEPDRITKSLPFYTNDKDSDLSLKEKIGSLVDQTMHDTKYKIKQVQSYKDSLKDVPSYKIGFILSLIKKTRHVINELYNVAVKHRDEWKALEQLKIFELVVHTNVDTGHLVRQMVEIHLQSLGSSTTPSQSINATTV